MAQKVDFWQICYGPGQECHLYPFAKAYKNTHLTEFFENEVILKVVPESTADKIGVCSWQLRDKLRFYIPPRREFTEDVLQEDYDVLLLTRNTHHHQMLAAADRWHPSFLRIFFAICDQIGLPRPTTEVKHPVYFNHFVAAREIYQEYVATALAPAMAVMTEDPEISKLCWQDSGYTKLKGTTPQPVADKWGYYPMHPFILERLFSVFINDRKFNIKHL
jgi:hypothetical protein